MIKNDITVRPAKFQVVFNDNTSCYYNHNESRHKSHNSIRLTHSHLLRAPPSNTTIWPGDYIEIDLPKSFGEDESVALEPRYDNSTFDSRWLLPNIITPVARKIRIPNSSPYPEILSQVHHTFIEQPSVTESITFPTQKLYDNIQSTDISYTEITIDPDNSLPPFISKDSKNYTKNINLSLISRSAVTTVNTDPFRVLSTWDQYNLHSEKAVYHNIPKISYLFYKTNSTSLKKRVYFNAQRT